MQTLKILLSMSMGIIAVLLLGIALLFCTTGEIDSAKAMLFLSAVMGITSCATTRIAQ